ELGRRSARIGADDDPHHLAAGFLPECPGERGDLGADPGEAPVGRGLAVHPDGACRAGRRHQMILRSARNATTWRAASSAGSRITLVAARGGGASVVRAAGGDESRPGAPSWCAASAGSPVVSIVFERAAMIPFSDG